MICAALSAACGKKGPPLAPLSRVPAAPAALEAARAGEDVYVWFTVPAANVSGETPADIGSLDLYAFTGVTPPSGPDLTKVAVKIGSYAVKPIIPPPPPAPEGVAPPPTIPIPPGFDQGGRAVLRETLTTEARIPTPIVAAAPAAAATEADLEPVPGPLVAPSTVDTLRRHYFVVGVSRRGRAGAPSAIASVPLDQVTSAPSAPAVTNDETNLTLTWTPPADARGAVVAPEAGLLPSKPLVPAPAATTYHVFDVPSKPVETPDPFAIPLPAAVSPQAIAATTFTLAGGVRFGETRCFVVRAVDSVAGATVLGPASEPGCLTPRDTFPPAAPRQLVAISGVGVINLIWEANAEPDLAGYIVLRGAAPGDTLTALTPSPIRDTQYRDDTAAPGVRYIYAVVAVDNATPQNVSGQSNRVEEASRQ